MHEHIGLDKTGVSLSALCLVHCLAGPLLILSFPVYEEFANETLFHAFLGPLLLLIAALAFYRGYQVHARSRVLIFGAIGLAFLAGGIFGPHEHVLGPLTAQAVLSMIGSVFLIAAHYWNIRYCRCEHHA